MEETVVVLVMLPDLKESTVSSSLRRSCARPSSEEETACSSLEEEVFGWLSESCPKR